MDTLIFDTSAIFNFGHRGQLASVLKKLASRYELATTPVVHDECLKSETAQFYKAFVPGNFEITPVKTIAIPDAGYRSIIATIHPGEISVILLAAELKAIAVLDDKFARHEAKRLGTRITGTLGLIEESTRLGWLDDDQCLEIVVRLRAAKFSIPKPGANETFAEYFLRLKNQ